MIEPAERAQWIKRFGGVPAEQVERDYFISHLLYALADVEQTALTFFGGTALCRTYLVDRRLSEDIDLLVDDLDFAVDELAPAWFGHRRLRGVGPVTWSDDQVGRFVRSFIVSRPNTAAVSVQFVARSEYERIRRSAPTPVALRYSDLASDVLLDVPSASSFCAMKAVAYFDRHAPRDLFDLGCLAQSGYLDAESTQLLRGHSGYGFIRADFERVPKTTVSGWEEELRHQTGNLPTPQACARAVLDALDGLDA